MNEEEVTEAIEAHLRASGWSIFAVDYPTTGSGLRIHPNNRLAGTKHAGSYVPDIVAFGDGRLLIVENKPRFDQTDVRKLSRISAGDYDQSLNNRVYATDYDVVITALGLPSAVEDDIPHSAKQGIDRLFLVNQDFSVREEEI